ncbi:MAG: COG1361 S-layer family protein [Candidatus Micrarchaeota archaeon]
MMKKTFLVLLCFAMVAQALETGLGSTLTISQLQYTPYPAEPGNYIDLRINVQTTQYIDSVECELVPQYPFSLDASENARRTIGSLGPGQAFSLKYKVRIDPAAVSGDNDLPVRCRSGSGDWITAKMQIKVQTSAASLMIQRVESNPERIPPGTIGTISVTFKNSANSPVRDVNVKLNVSDTTFSPIGGGVEKLVGVILGQEEKTLEFKLASLATADSKTYRIPIEISYKDELGTVYSTRDYIGISVGETPSLLVEISSSEVIKPNTAGTVEFKIINNGMGDIKFLNAVAENGPLHEIASEPSMYIGTLAGDDSETVDYKIYVGNTEGSVQIPLKLTYRDSTNQEYSQTINAKLRIYTNEELSRFGMSNDGTNIWLILIGVVVVGYLAYTYWWKKRR